ncbi:hypothetical protein CYMTET_27459 [Cymbomonas tetramitiformis]|uniref:Uncharacterized protein n=1 Tax=Cymbomonas tetramitiformis TaxID=36881 RepID=A0AAE0FPU0_9CHLO|nr:hypothetical protein CYMTET_27459 [Cymbomonas tetramitiformis]
MQHPVMLALPRHQLCIAAGLQIRDLRCIDPHFRKQLPSILVRPLSMVVSLGAAKAIIFCDMVLLFDHQKPEIKGLVRELQSSLAPTKRSASSWISLNDPPFEFKALATLLDIACTDLDDRCRVVEEKVLGQTTFPLENISCTAHKRNMFE